MLIPWRVDLLDIWKQMDGWKHHPPKWNYFSSPICDARPMMDASSNAWALLQNAQERTYESCNSATYKGPSGDCNSVDFENQTDRRIPKWHGDT